MRGDAQFIAMVAAILVSGTSATPEEAVAKAKALIAVAESAASEEEEGDD